MEAGPNSRNRPVRELHPGPPFSHRTTGSFFGSFRDSKNPRIGDQINGQAARDALHSQ